jgi:hypothetical protein
MGGCGYDPDEPPMCVGGQQQTTTMNGDSNFRFEVE